jgi:hypothetical protein
MSEHATAVLVDISETWPDRAARDRMLDWAASYLVDDVGEDSAIRLVRLSLWFRNEAFRTYRRRGMKVSFEQTDMIAMAMVIAALRRRNEAMGAGHVRH